MLCWNAFSVPALTTLSSDCNTNGHRWSSLVAVSSPSGVSKSFCTAPRTWSDVGPDCRLVWISRIESAVEHVMTTYQRTLQCTATVRPHRRSESCPVKNTGRGNGAKLEPLQCRLHSGHEVEGVLNSRLLHLCHRSTKTCCSSHQLCINTAAFGHTCVRHRCTTSMHIHTTFPPQASSWPASLIPRSPSKAGQDSADPW